MLMTYCCQEYRIRSVTPAVTCPRAPYPPLPIQWNLAIVIRKTMLTQAKTSQRRFLLAWNNGDITSLKLQDEV